MGARLFLTILSGSSPDSATPIIATEDKSVLDAATREIATRLNLRLPGSWPPKGSKVKNDGEYERGCLA